MEMPEGYKRLEKQTESYRGQRGMDIDSALKFMKEMAEVLQDVKECSLIQYSEDSQLCKLLTKFKEWE